MTVNLTEQGKNHLITLMKTGYCNSHFCDNCLIENSCRKEYIDNASFFKGRKSAALLVYVKLFGKEGLFEEML